jgi:hypothetical protein
MQWTVLERPLLDQPHIFLRLFHQFMPKFVGSYGWYQRLSHVNHPFTSETLTKSRGQSMQSHRIQVSLAVISAALASRKQTGGSEVKPLIG